MELYGSLLNISGSVTASTFTGSFIGDGSGLTGIQASSVIGLNLSQIATGSSSASLTPNGFNVNTDTSITGSLNVSGVIISETTPLVSSSIQVDITGTTGYSTFISTIATTGSNTFIGNQLINGNLNITGSLTASGLIYPTVDGPERSFIQTDGFGNLTFSYVETMVEPIKNGESFQLPKGSPVYVSGSQGATPIVFLADAGNPNKMPVMYIVGENVVPNEIGIGILLGKIEGVNTTGYSPGTEVFVGVGGGWTAVRPTGSAIIQPLGIVTKEGNGGQGIVLNPGPVTLPNITPNKLWVGDSTSYPIEKSVTEIGLTTTSSFNTYTQSVNNKIESLETESGSIRSNFNSYTSSNNTLNNTQNSRLDDLEISTSSLNTFTSSINTTIKNKLNNDDVISGSIQVNISETTGYSTFSSSISTSIGQLSSSVATTTNNLSGTIVSLSSSFSNTDDNHENRLNTIESHYATTGSNNFVGNQTITGSLFISQNLIVQGSSSLENITASAVSIGTNTIILNTDTPAFRYAGISVFDSGSTDVTASLFYDSLTNHWKFKRVDVGDSDASIVIFGPKGSDIDNTLELTGNYLTKVENDGHGHHITTSSIFDNGNKVSINSNTEITGSLVVTGIIRSNTTTLVSGSSQITYGGLSGIPTGIVSGSSQIDLSGTTNYVSGIKSRLNAENVVSGSSQISFNGITDKPTLVSGSSQISFIGITDTPSSYSGQGGKIVAVNSVANGLEFLTKAQYLGGTSSQFVKGDGSLDSTSYYPSSNPAGYTSNLGTVTSVTASSPLSSSGGTTPNITIQQASGSQSGFLSSTDWTTFNNKLSQSDGDARYLRLTGGTLTGQLNIGTGGVGMQRTQDNNAIWFNAGADTNHVLWNTYFGGPTTRTGSPSGFDGIHWNTYQGIHIRGGLGGEYNCIVVANSSSNTNDHTVSLYASNVLRLQTTTSGVNIFGNLVSSGTLFSTNGGVDGTFADAFVGRFSSNNAEQNAIQTSVSSVAQSSGFRFQASNGGGSSGRTNIVDLLRNRAIFYTNVTIGTTTAAPTNGLLVQGNIIYNGSGQALNTDNKSTAQLILGENSLLGRIGFKNVPATGFIDSVYEPLIYSLHSGTVSESGSSSLVIQAGGTGSDRHMYFRTANNTRLFIGNNGNILPGANGTQNLGSSSLRWNTVFTSDLSMSNGIGDYTIVEGEEDLFIYNNKTNKVFKFLLQEVDPSIVPPKKD